MKSRLLLFGLCTAMIMQAADKASPVVEVEQKIEWAKKYKNLPKEVIAGLEKYDPIRERCGAAINTAGVTTISANLPGAFYCMLVGNKKVYYGSRGQFDDSLSKEEQRIINSDMVVAKVPRVIEGNPMIIYTKDPCGQLLGRLLVKYVSDNNEQRKIEIEAFMKKPVGEIQFTPEVVEQLMNRENKKFPLNDYLIGLLLGYTEEDIDAYYRKTGKSYSDDKLKTDAFLKMEDPEGKVGSCLLNGK